MSSYEVAKPYRSEINAATVGTCTSMTATSTTTTSTTVATFVLARQMWNIESSFKLFGRLTRTAWKGKEAVRRRWNICQRQLRIYLSWPGRYIRERTSLPCQLASWLLSRNSVKFLRMLSGTGLFITGYACGCSLCSRTGAMSLATYHTPAEKGMAQRRLLRKYRRA